MEENTLVMDEEFGVDLSEFVSSEDGNQTDEPETEQQEEQTEQPEVQEESKEEQTPPDAQPEGQEEFFDLKFNKETRKVSRQEMTELAQKGLNHDRILAQRDNLQRENAELLKFREENESLIGFLDTAAKNAGTDRNTFLQSIRENAYVSQGLSRDAAHERVLREDAERKLSKADAQETERKQAQKTAEQQQAAQRQDVERFLKLYKDVDPNTIPKEVWDEVRNGETLVSAYGRYENRKLSEDNRKLQESINAMKQNEKNKQKSIGSMKSEGKETGTDPFLMYFMSDD